MLCRVLLVLSAGFLLSTDLFKTANPLKGPTEEVLVALERQALDAVKKQDVETLKRMTADDYQGILYPEGRETKQQMLQNVADCSITEYTLTDIKAVALGPDAGVLTYTVVYKGTFKGKEIPPDPLIATAIWARRAGVWQCVLYQETPIVKE